MSGGYVDGHVSGWTELRVHGVSGTPPTAMLEHPNVALVAGYGEAGFFRRWWPARSVAADTEDGRLEAYSWGGLTSGDTTRALWLLLLPFMLLNVAYFMAPSRRPPDPADPAVPLSAEARAARRRDRVSGSVQSVLALSFTVTFTLTTISVAMDLVGWQCLAGRLPGGRACGAAWLEWLTWGPLDRPGRQLALTALVPLATIGLLWWLGRTTWRNLEAVPVTQSDAPAARTPLEDRALWNGRAAVRRLRALHVAAALALPGVAALTPYPVVGAAAVPRVLLLGLLVVVTVLTARPTTRSRARPEADPERAWRRQQEQEQAERGDLYRRLPWTALGLTGVALVFAAVVPVPAAPSGSLPWLVAGIQAVFGVQVVLLVALLGACLWLRRHRADGAATSGPDVANGPLEESPAWRGLAMPGIALLAWVLAGGFSAGVILRAAQVLGTAVSRGQASTEAFPLIVPSAYSWAAVGGLALGLLALGGAGVVWWRVRVRRPSAATCTAVDLAYPDAPGAAAGRAGEQTAAAAAYRERRDRIARAWHEAAALRREAQGVAGFLLVATVVVVVAGVAGFLTIGPRLLSGLPGLVTAANVFVTLFVLGLVALGRQAYRSAGTRRTVGILWDLGTFWPRAVHPLAPPCYAERAVPDLLLRLRHYADRDGRVLLSCHSQGSVLGAAVLLQAESAVSARAAFLTYGSPLARLYARFFPAYVDRRALDRLGALLGGAGDPPGDRARWRWRNLYRPSDPIGGAVFVERPAGTGTATGDADPGDVDRALRDPVFARAAGDPCLPAVLGHSDYFADPAFDETVDALHAALPAGSPAGPPPPGAVVPELDGPDGAVPEPAVPESGPPDAAVPEPAAPDPAAPERGEEPPLRRPAPPVVWR